MHNNEVLTMTNLYITDPLLFIIVQLLVINYSNTIYYINIKISLGNYY